MSTNDYVKFMAESLIRRLETPKAERRKIKDERKQMKTPFLMNWFGMVPYSLLMWMKKRQKTLHD